jgi:hypothetical protein
MKLSRRYASLLVTLAALGESCAGLAQGVPAASDAATPPPNLQPEVQPDYHPSMGDLMTMAIQPRHIKLQLAGTQQNWAYANYELSELRHAFDRIARTIPKYQSIDTATISTAVTRAPLDALEQAINIGSAPEFAVAYAQLTQACNACHQSLKHAAIVIKVPDSAMFPDQDFRPSSPSEPIR